MSERDGKTEKATPKKLQDARKKGQVAKSSDLTSAVSFIVFVLFGTFFGKYVLEKSFLFLRKTLSDGLSVSGFENNLNNLGLQMILFFFILVGPFLAIGFFASLIGAGVQTRFLFSAKAIKMDFKKINPVSGFKNLFSKKVWVMLAKNIAKLTLVFYLAFSTVSDAAGTLVNTSDMGPEKLFFVLTEVVKKLSVTLAIILLVLGVGDYLYEVYEYRKNLRMTKQEIKDEFKENEGDPQIKGQRKQQHRAMLIGMLKQVETATVVVTNPTHLAIAIRYERGKDEVPIVVAKGADYIAEKIREKARAFEVPIIENKPTARALYPVIQIGQPIPYDLYQSIAEILALVYQMEEMKKQKI
ncbi:flagellar biosynthesis protein FlhB [Pisciglobus halotolerans]|uniref:Flagellar biosynthetic protein FlhB n=1 Tax=Pisciglobus halotolerans TaxID=745365 RepID=A0A1I3AND8_9LACT|nr:flagellar biosynthesis protein FlhB [Pisciglobus halotolerans]SFH51326.1 flagellar biosynthetic protein FlhB [Pisciglobus halotolerans]